MKKLTRREFFKLSAIWGTVPLLPKWLSFKEGVPEEEESKEDTSHPWDDGDTLEPYHLESPYFTTGWEQEFWGGVSDGPIMVWYDKEEPTE